MYQPASCLFLTFSIAVTFICLVRDVGGSSSGIAVGLTPKCTDALCDIMGDAAPGNEAVACDGSDGSELLLGRMDFMPHNVIAPWTCPLTVASKLSVAVLIPSGISPESLTVTAFEKCLQIEVVWPKALEDPVSRPWEQYRAIERSCNTFLQDVIASIFISCSTYWSKGRAQVR